MSIYLARHGQDEDNAAGILNGHRDTPLTALGREQAADLARTIVEHKIVLEKIYSSPLQRAFATAQIVAATLKLSMPEKVDLLIERDFGIMSGKPNTDIETVCGSDVLKTEKITYFLSPEGAETFPVLLERGKKVLEYFKGQDNILLVTHGDIGKMIYAAFYNLPWREVLSDFHFGNTELLLLKEASNPEARRLYITKQFNS